MKEIDKLKETLEEIHKLAEESVLYLPKLESLDHKKEPLIKDEKVRKAVRAWGYSPLKFHRHSRKGYATFQICSKYICFNELFEGLKDGNYYTIAELCGEEEE